MSHLQSRGSLADSEKGGVRGWSSGNWMFGLEFKDVVENANLRES